MDGRHRENDGEAGNCQKPEHSTLHLIKVRRNNRCAQNWFLAPKCLRGARRFNHGLKKRRTYLRNDPERNFGSVVDSRRLVSAISRDLVQVEMIIDERFFNVSKSRLGRFWNWQDAG
jgi:hypothetical protein